MNNTDNFRDYLTSSLTNDIFREASISAYRYHLAYNPVYRRFVELIGRSDLPVNDPEQIPFLPVGLFRDNIVIPEGKKSEIVFSSSTTTGTKPSQHYISDKSVYLKSLEASFRFAFGEPAEYIYVALLPSYLERNDSSLVFMMKALMDISKDKHNGFFLNEYKELSVVLERINKSGKKCIFLGVTFALLDFSAKYPMPLGENITLIETGGMKGRSKDIPRKELHEILCRAFSKKAIAGEYGMTELLSQCYSLSGGVYRTPPWFRVFARDLHDPFTILKPGEFGALNIIDLANINSCPFVATDDTGIVYDDGKFIVSGRVTSSDIRGCNLMV